MVMRQRNVNTMASKRFWLLHVHVLEFWGNSSNRKYGVKKLTQQFISFDCSDGKIRKFLHKFPKFEMLMVMP